MKTFDIFGRGNILAELGHLTPSERYIEPKYCLNVQTVSVGAESLGLTGSIAGEIGS